MRTGREWDWHRIKSNSRKALVLLVLNPWALLRDVISKMDLIWKLDENRRMKEVVEEDIQWQTSIPRVLNLSVLLLDRQLTLRPPFHCLMTHEC
jgi:hypothetical protein